MRADPTPLSLWSRKWFRMISWTILISLILICLPFLIELLLRLSHWILGLEVSPWSS